MLVGCMLGLFTRTQKKQSQVACVYVCVCACVCVCVCVFVCIYVCVCGVYYLHI